MMHPSRIAVIAGALLAVGSLPLGYLDAPPPAAVTGWESGAAPAIVLLVVAAVAASIGDRREGLPGPGTLLVVLAAAGATVYSVAKLVDADAAAELYQAAGAPASPGVGVWLLVGGAILALTGAVATTSRRVV